MALLAVGASMGAILYGLHGLPTASVYAAVPAAATVTGSLDASFGSGGKVITPFGTGDASVSISVLTLQSDGKIIAGGRAFNGNNYDWALARYNSDGALDATFGSGGKVTTDFFGGDDEADAMALQTDGKIVAGGYARTSGMYVWVIARYNRDGTPDPLFGNGGIVTTSIRGASPDIVHGLAIDGNGKIVAAGYSGNGSEDDVAVVRYNGDGSLDATFGSGGKVTTPIGSTNDRGNAVIVQPDGKIAVFGDFDAGGHDGVFLVRYNPNGSLDTGFGSGGKVTTQVGGPSSQDGGRSLILQRDGKFVATGQTYPFSGATAGHTFVMRYNSDGSLDAGFGSGGKVVQSLSSSDAGIALALQSDGKIVVTGYIDTNASAQDLAVTRFNSDGSLDAGFGSGGTVITDLGAGNDAGTAIATQVDGKLVVAGYAFGSNHLNFALVRYGGSVSDVTPPLIRPNVSPLPNTNGWNNSNVVVTWSVSDPESGITSSIGCGSTTLTAETAGTALNCSATNGAGLTADQTVTIRVDKAPPLATATPDHGAVPVGVPLVTVNATATVKDRSGATLGTIGPITCWNSREIVITLNAADPPGGSGVQRVTYAATGAQPIATTTATTLPARMSITAAGLTTLTSSATDRAGNQGATGSESVLVGSMDDDGTPFACAAPTPGFQVPAHGSLVVSGTATVGSTTYPFHRTVRF